MINQLCWMHALLLSFFSTLSILNICEVGTDLEDAAIVLLIISLDRIFFFFIEKELLPGEPWSSSGDIKVYMVSNNIQGNIIN